MNFNNDVLPIDAHVKQIILEKLIVRGGTSIPTYTFNRAKFHQYEDHYMDAIVISCELAIASIKDSNVTTTDKKTKQHDLKKYPKTIWDYFKEKYAPQWFIEKYPVQYVEYFQNITTITEQNHTITKVFPDITIDNHKEILRIYDLKIK